MSPLRAGLLLIFLSAVAAWPSSAAAATATCSMYTNQAAAQAAGDTRDGDHDGIYCEALPCPCSTAPPGGPAPAAASPPAAPTKGAGPRPEEVLRGRVTEVVDGDTIKVQITGGKPATVRLIGIDTPETRDPRRPTECGGRRATSAMKALVLDHRGRGRVVKLTTDPTQDKRDRYGRLLAYVTTDASQVNVGRKLVALGWATTYIYNTVPFRQVAAFQAAEADAKASNRGVYRVCGGNFHRRA